VTIMHAKTKRIIGGDDSTLLQASTKLADWRPVIPHLLGLRSSPLGVCRYRQRRLNWRPVTLVEPNIYPIAVSIAARLPDKYPAPL